MQSLDIQSISSNNTPMLAPDEDNTIQFSVKQVQSFKGILVTVREFKDSYNSTVI